MAADGRAPQHSVRTAHGPDFTETIMSDPTDPAATTDLRAAAMAAVVQCRGVRGPQKIGGVR